jgi:prepilin-type N-terminal cleavage/methylation domain-containing protein
MKHNMKRGFTLIELLVVIAIIGILSSVVLASLNTARNKGANAAVKSNLNNIRAQAEIYYDGTGAGTYGVAGTGSVTSAGVWTTAPAICSAAASVGGIGAGIAAAAAAGGSTGYCNVVAGSSPAWAAGTALKVAETGGGFWCVDSTGISRAIVASVGTATVCPAS